MISKIPEYMGRIIKFGCLVGLRSAEIIIESVRLINDKEAFPNCYDQQQMTLQHWKFKQFLRTTKKAFFEFCITPDFGAGSKPRSYGTFL
jgi:hypothetical protein